jgi:hypothetical protein
MGETEKKDPELTDEATSVQDAPKLRRETIEKLAGVLEESVCLFRDKNGLLDIWRLRDVLEAAGNLAIPDYQISVRFNSYS